MTSKKTQSQEILLIPAEVAAVFRVNPKTVTRWAKAGKLGSAKTLGGHRRFVPEEIKEVMRRQYQGKHLESLLESLDALVEAKKLAPGATGLVSADESAEDLLDRILQEQGMILTDRPAA